MRTEQLAVDAIIVQDRKRGLREEAVAPLMESMGKMGLKSPIAVRYIEEVVTDDGVILHNVPVLVAGRHRLEAASRLGWAEIDTVEIEDETDARLWEISENLHRAELLPVERAEHIDEWDRLVSAKIAETPNPQGGRPGSGAATARALNVSETTVRNAKKIASLPEPVRQQARDEGWTNNRLLAAAAPPKPVPVPKNELETEDDWRAGMMRLWNRAPDEWRERFIDYVQAPVFDRTAAGL